MTGGDGLHPKTGIMLQGYRERKGMTLIQLATRAHVPYDDLQQWEKGGKIPSRFLSSLIEGLGLSPLESERFIIAAKPDLWLEAEQGTLAQHIKQKDWAILGESQPARSRIRESQPTPEKIKYLPDERVLDREWLEAQPRRAQAGLVIKYFRERAGLSHRDVADALKVASRMPELWEEGTRAVFPEKLAPLVQLLNVPNEQERYLRAHVMAGRSLNGAAR